MVLAVALLLFQFPAAPASSATTPAANAAPSAASARTMAFPEAHKDARFVPGPSESLPWPIWTSSVPNLASSPSAHPKLGSLDPPPIILPPPKDRLKIPVDLYSPPRKSWLLLSGLQHGAAAFDAWSTRRAVAAGRVEGDPLMAPFAHSSSIYAAIQVAPVGFDYLARRMERSTGWIRHIWWLPQSLAAATYLFSGSYNLAHTR